MNTTRALVAVAMALAVFPSACAEEPATNPEGTTPATPTGVPKLTHDWPCYMGPLGTFADSTQTPLLDDFSKARLVWKSEDKSIGWGKTTSGESNLTKRAPGMYPSGQGSLIVAGGMVIAGYFIPSGEAIQKEAEGVAAEFRQRALVAADDVILAVDAATGKTRWKQVFAGKGINRGAGKRPSYGPTPAAADGRVFHIGTTGRIYCVELTTGKPLWESSGGPEDILTSLVVCEQVLLVPSGGTLLGFDVASGKRLWECAHALSGDNVPCPVVVEGQPTLFCINSQGELRLIEPKTGKVLWMQTTTPRINHSTQPVAADGKAFIWSPLASDSGKGGPVGVGRPACYTLGLAGAKLLWELPDEYRHGMGRGGGPCAKMGYREGMAYFGSLDTNSIVAVKADDGKILAKLSPTFCGQFHLWGDKLVLIGDNSHESMGLVCTYTPYTLELKRTGKSYSPRRNQGVSGYIFPIRDPFADGFQFMRAATGEIWCWDLRARAAGAQVLKIQFHNPLQGWPKESNFAKAEAVLEGGKITQCAFDVPVRTDTGVVKSGDGRQVVLKDAIDFAGARGEGSVLVPVQLEDLESWKLSLQLDGQAISGTYERQIPALKQTSTVDGVAEAKMELRPGDARRWIVNLTEAVSRDFSATKVQKKDMYIVLDRSPGGETEGWARAKGIGNGTHEVAISRFEPDDKMLVLKGTVLLHADTYLSPSAERAGTVAMEVEVSLKREGEAWKGTYTARHGVAWACPGALGGEQYTQGKTPAN